MYVISVESEYRIISSRLTVANAAIAILSELLVHAVWNNTTAQLRITMTPNSKVPGLHECTVAVYEEANYGIVQ